MSNIDLSQMITAEARAQAARETAFATLADLRWQRETGGLALPDGRRADTSREGRAQLNSTLLSLQTGLMTAPVAWKLLSGWEDLTEEQITALAAAVQAHVSRCFAAERSVSAQMAGLPGSLGGFDIAGAFGTAFTAALTADGPQG